MDDTFVPLEAAARRMGLTTDQTLELVRRRVLRAEDYGLGLIFVQPAILSGWRPGWVAPKNVRKVERDT